MMLTSIYNPALTMFICIHAVIMNKINYQYTLPSSTRPRSNLRNKNLLRMGITWKEEEVAEWRRSVAQCIHLDAGGINIKEYSSFLPRFSHSGILSLRLEQPRRPLFTSTSTEYCCLPRSTLKQWMIEPYPGDPVFYEPSALGRVPGRVGWQ